MVDIGDNPLAFGLEIASSTCPSQPMGTVGRAYGVEVHAVWSTLLIPHGIAQVEPVEGLPIRVPSRVMPLEKELRFLKGARAK